MRVLIVLLAVLALPPAAGAQVPPREPDPSITDGSAQAALDAARERWREQGVRDYAFDARLSCFCPPEYRRTERIVVREGAAVDPPRRYRSVATVAKQFRRVQRAIDDGVAGLDVAYGRRGRPLRIFIDQDLMIQDEEVGYTFNRFRAAGGS